MCQTLSRVGSVADKTRLEWTDATWNPVTGCTKVSPGCDHCYAETFTNRFKRHPFTEVTLHPDRMTQPFAWKTPRMIFTCSMGDLFHSAVPWTFILAVFCTMAETERHTYQVLTTRPGRMAYFAEHIWSKVAPWPANVWAGTSVESQKYAPRLDVLARVPAQVRFVSYEPALGPVDLYPFLNWCRLCLDPRDGHDDKGWGHYCRALDWVIAGGESGPGARPAHPDWIRSARDQCQAAGVPFFFKQWGEWAAAGQERAPDSLGHMVLVESPGGSTIPMMRVGKKAAGAVLDGQEWREFPQATRGRHA